MTGLAFGIPPSPNAALEERGVHITSTRKASTRCKARAHATRAVSQTVVLSDLCVLFQAASSERTFRPQAPLSSVVYLFSPPLRAALRAIASVPTKCTQWLSGWVAGRLACIRQMTTELQAHSKALEDESTKSARDVGILKEKDEEYARQGQAKSKEVCSCVCASACACACACASSCACSAATATTAPSAAWEFVCRGF